MKRNGKSGARSARGPVGFARIESLESRQLLSVAVAAALEAAPITNAAVVKPATATVYGSVSGTVTDASGNPIAGASVYLVPAAGASDSSNLAATTNASGQYSLSSVPTGSYIARADDKAYLAGSSASFTVSAGDNTAPKIALKLGAVFSGTITDANHTPLSGATVEIISTTGSSTSEVTSTTTNSLGQYSTYAVAPGTYSVHAYDTGYLSNASASINAVAGTDAVPTIELTKIIYGSVTGLVTDANGKAISGATVYVTPTTSNANPTVASVQTNASGDYTFPDVPVGTYTVHAYVAGYLESTSAAFSVVQGANVAPTLKLAEAGAVSGLITDANNVALAGASVTLAPATSNSGLPTYSATTSSTGTYSFSAVVPGSYIVHAAETGYAYNSSAAFIVAAGQDSAPTVKLTKIIYGSVSGLVTDANGNPISNATVYITPATSNSNPSVASVQTNASGDYAFPNVPVGTYTVHASAAGYFESTSASFAVAQGANVAPTLKLVQAASLSGLITDANGVALAGASVSIAPATSGSGLPTYTATSSSTGTYAFSAIVPGSYIVRAAETGYASNASAAFNIAAGPNTAPTVKLTKIIYGSVSGLVTDANGNPIDGATVYITSTTTNSNPSVASVQTNSSGDYVFPNVPVGTYTVHAYAVGYFESTSASFAVAQGANVAPTLKLAQAAAVSGLITDANGVALAGASVSLAPATSGSGLPSYSTTTSSTGTYSFASVVPGSYIIHASETGYTYNSSAAFTVAAGPNTAPTVKLTKIISGSVSGAVTDSNGAPISGATVYISSTTANSNPSVASVQTNSSGDYSFPNVPVGTYTVHAYAPGYLEATSASFTVAQGANVAPTLKLTAAGVVSGLVTSSSSAPISGASVTLVPSSTPNGTAIEATATGSNGSYTFQSVPVGSYIVRVTDSGYFANSSSAFTVVAGPDTAPTVQLTPAPVITAIGPGATTSPGTVLNTLTPTFTWTPTSAAGVTGYQINLYDITTQTMHYIIVDGESASSYTLAAGILTSGNDYIWNIRVINGSSTGPESNYFYFQA